MKNKTPVLKLKERPHLRYLRGLFAAAVVSGLGAYLVTMIYAATGSMSLLPSASTVNIGSNFTVAIRENSSTDPVNAVQSNISFDPARVQYVGVDFSGSAFPLEASTITGTGSLQIARATNGGGAPLTGDNLIATVTFKALTTGSTTVSFASGSALVRSTDNTNMLSVQNNATITLSDLAPPTVPGSLTTTSVALTSINLSWAASTDNVGVASYRVFRNNTQVGTSTTTTYNDAGLNPGTAYTYRVSAVDAAGNVSAQSTAITPSTQQDTTAPSVPGKPTSASQTMTSINLAWPASTDNIAVTGYKLYRNGALIASPTAAAFNDTGLVPNTSYNYTVAAVDAAGNVSAQSTASAIKTLPDSQAPTIPAGLTGSISGQNINLSWSPATDNVAVTSYVIYRSGAQIATSTAANYTVTNALVGTYTYTVAAKDAAGNTSSQSNGVTLQTYKPSDINSDNKVDVFDLSVVLSNWAKTGTVSGDVNKDGVVNVFDLSIILSGWTG